jgi:hypothetical protein
VKKDKNKTSFSFYFANPNFFHKKTILETPFFLKSNMEEYTIDGSVANFPNIKQSSKGKFYDFHYLQYSNVPLLY